MCFHSAFYVFYSQAGFFKSKYKQMINDEAEQGADPGAEASAPEDA